MKYLKVFEEAKVKWYKKGEFSPPEESEDIKIPYRIVIFNVPFTNFLIKHEAYDDYLNELQYQVAIDITNPNKIFNHLNQRLRDDGNGDIRNLIDVSFIWSDTRDPYKWENLDRVLRYAYDNNLFEEAKIKWYNNKEFSDPEHSEFDPYESKDIIYDEKFTRFLISYDIYDQFIREISFTMNRYKSDELKSIEHINEYLRNKIGTKNHREIINSCLSWNKTITGVNWQNMHGKIHFS